MPFYLDRTTVSNQNRIHPAAIAKPLHNATYVELRAADLSKESGLPEHSIPDVTMQGLLVNNVNPSRKHILRGTHTSVN